GSQREVRSTLLRAPEAATYGHAVRRRGTARLQTARWSACRARIEQAPRVHPCAPAVSAAVRHERRATAYAQRDRRGQPISVRRGTTLCRSEEPARQRRNRRKTRQERLCRRRVRTERRRVRRPLRGKECWPGGRLDRSIR